MRTIKRIDIKGFIIPKEDKWIYDWFEYPYTCAEDVNSALKEANGDDVEVYINSYGGAIHIGSEIYTSLKDYKGNVLIKIVGLAASAASVIGMGGRCLMSPTAQMMIHNASTGAQGDYRVMDKTSKMLQITNKSILNAYKLKSGLGDDEIKAIMDEETWLTAERAKELGLIDEIMFDEQQKEDTTNEMPMIYNSLPIPSLKAIEEMRRCGSIEKFKENIIEKQVLAAVNMELNQAKNKEEEVQMDLNTFRNEHKDLYDQVVENAVANERKRIKAIDEIAMPGFENLVNEAKYTTGVSAEQLAVELIKASKETGKKHLEDIKDDSSQLLNINGTSIPQDEASKLKKEDNAAKSIAEAMNKKRRS